MNGKHGKIRTGSQTSLQLHRLPVRPEGGQGQTHPRALADLKCKDTETAAQTNLSGLTADVSNRVINSYRKASPTRSTPYEADKVALLKQLEGARISRKGNPYPKVTPPLLKLVAPGRKHSSRPTIKPP